MLTMDLPRSHTGDRTALEVGPRLRALIVEDEPAARLRLRSLCSREEDIDVVACVASAAEAIEPLANLKPNLLFVDVRLRRSTALELLRSAPADAAPLIVFTAARAEYAIQAFDEAAIDYLLKPFSDERFHAAVVRARARAQSARPSAPQPDPWRGPGGGRHLVGEKDGRFYFLNPNDVESVVAAHNWVCLTAKGVTYLARQPMRQLELRLEGSSLVRIHKSFMINLDHVRYMERAARGSFTVTMRSGALFRSSPLYRSTILLRTRVAG
jgi:two-component system LytT family response regulator